MVSPALISGYSVATVKLPYWHFFGLNVAQAGYQGTVLPVLVVAWILATLEKFFHKHINSAFDFTFTPMLAIIITGFLTFTFVGPLMRGVSDGLSFGLTWLYNTSGPIGTAIFGFFYAPIVITGLHQSFPAIETTLLATLQKTGSGGDFLFPIATMSNIAQGAATLAVFIITKNQKTKGLSFSASVSALLGITEPAMFGVNLKLKYPFFCAITASGISSIIIGAFHVLGASLGPASVIGFICIRPDSVPAYLVASIVSFVLAFVATYFYGKYISAKPAKTEIVATNFGNAQIGTEATEATLEEGEERLSDEIIGAPVVGKTASLKTVSDKVFSSEMMGRGVSIVPTNGEVFAPCDGRLTVFFETGHAYGITTEQGAEVLIHIGVDTVNLNGKFFTSYVKRDQILKKGDKLCSFDLEGIKKAGYDPTIITVITNTAHYASVERVAVEEVQVGDNLIALTAK